VGTNKQNYVSLDYHIYKSYTPAWLLTDFLGKHIQLCCHVTVVPIRLDIMYCNIFLLLLQTKLTQLLKTTQLEQLSKLQAKHQQECDLLDEIRCVTC